MRNAATAAILALGLAGAAQAAINVSLRPTTTTVSVGNTIALDIFATPSTGANEGILSFQVIFSWNTALLRLTGSSTAGAPPLTGAGFFRDAYGINEATLPADGNAILVGLGPLGSSIIAPPGGVKLSTLLFQALAPTPGTPVGVLASGGSPVGTTAVYGDAGPNVDVTGALSGATITIIPGPGALGLIAVAGVFGTRRRRRDA